MGGSIEEIESDMKKKKGQLKDARDEVTGIHKLLLVWTILCSPV